MRKPALSLLAVTVLAGCSSGHGTAAPTSTTSPACAGPKAVATALASSLLDRAVLPPGVRPYRGQRSDVASGPAGGTPDLLDRVQAHRVYALTGSMEETFHFLERHRPRGFVASGSALASFGTTHVRSVYHRLAVLPPNISDAELQVGVETHRRAADRAPLVVRVDAIVGWTQPRPREEFVTARDHVVMVSVVHEYPPGQRVGRHVIVTEPGVVRGIVRAFNALRVAPRVRRYHCPPFGIRTVSYRVTFRESPTAAPDLVATIGKCGPVGVTLRGHALPALAGFAGGDFGVAVAHVLGLDEPHLG